MANQITWTSEQYQEHLLKRAKKKMKYKNKKVQIDGIWFDSMKEGKRYIVLKDMHNRGEISHLELQPKYLLVEGLVWHGQKLQSRYYTADFRYVKGGKTIVEDVKSVFTRKLTEYTMKRLLFVSKYPEVDFYEV